MTQKHRDAGDVSVVSDVSVAGDVSVVSGVSVAGDVSAVSDEGLSSLTTLTSLMTPQRLTS